MTAWNERDDWREAWNSARDILGQDLLHGESIDGVDNIERGMVRRFCEGLEIDCPLFYDAAIAQRFGYRDIVAPISGVTQAWVDGGSWRPGDATEFPMPDKYLPPARRQSVRLNSFGIGPPTTAGAQTDMSMIYHAPAYVGDRLAQRNFRLVAVEPKETSVGRGAFLTFENEVANQFGELIATVERATFQYEPFKTFSKPQRDVSTDVSVDPPEVVPPSSEIDWSVQRTFDGVHVGDAIPPVVFNLTLGRLVIHAGSDRDFSAIHHNEHFAQRTGAASAYANNVFCQGMWERAVREFIGLAGEIHEVRNLRMRRFNVAGAQIIVRGRIVDKFARDDTYFVAIEIESKDGAVVTNGPGKVIVSLPKSDSEPMRGTVTPMVLDYLGKTVEESNQVRRQLRATKERHVVGGTFVDLPRGVGNRIDE